MDDKFRAILESIPKNRQRSKLEPYTELIEQLRRRGYPYREIASILAEKCELMVASTTIVRFVAARSREKRERTEHLKSRKARKSVSANISVNISPNVSDHEVRKRIEALKQQPAKSPHTSKQFEYDPDQPLHLPHKK